ncbi:MAG: hypothetical protein ACI4K7_03190, partial [Oscillospiraceae bacterium]
MSDDKFSLDELLNEYNNDTSSEFDLDSILNGYPEIEQEPFEPEMEKRRMELIKKEIISGDYEHKYLGDDYRDVIDEEKRRKEDKARKIAEFSKAMEKRAAEEEAQAAFSEKRGSLSEMFREAVNSSEASSDSSATREIKTVSKPEAAADSAAPVIEEKPDSYDSRKNTSEEKPKRRKNKIAEEEQDEFQRKYDELKRRGLGVTSKSERRASAASEAFDEVVSEMERSAGPGRTFSEKAEEDSPYGDDYEDISELRRRKKAPAVVTDKSGLVSYTQYNEAVDEEIRSADDPLDSITGNSVDKILNEYEKSKTFTAATLKVGDKTNTISDIFDKLLKPDEPEETEDGKKASTNTTELMENMKKAKKERLSKTSHVPPIERTMISDLDLKKLDDKIIRDDTSPISPLDENEEAELLNDLQERRSKRIKDFVFLGDEEESEGDDNEDTSIDDFENMDDALSIAEDIAQSKGSMIVRLLILIACFVISLYITVSNELSAPVFEFVSMVDEPGTYLFVNTIIGMIAAFASYNAITVGLARLFTLRANCDSLAALTSIITIALSMAGLLDTNLVRDGILHEYVPLGIAALIFNTLGKLLLLSRTQRNFKYISGDYDHCAMFTVKDEEQAEAFTRGALTDFPTLASMRRTEMVSDFMKNSYSPDMADRFCKMFAPIIIIASLLIGVIGAAAGWSDYESRSIYIGLSAFVGCLCLCSCYSSMLIVNLPMQKASKKYSQMQGAVIGFDAIDEFSDTNSIMADASQLFPQGSVYLSNIKIFSDTRIDEAIVEAASLACRSDSIMKNMFFDIIGGKTELLNPVESYIYEDSMGLCGWINNKRVLLGNRKLMENHSIDGMPSPQKEKQYTNGGASIPVYLSISGELSAMFIINLTPVPEVAQTLRELDRKHIKVILRSVDSAVSVERMAQMFDISPDTLKILPFREHSNYEQVTSYTPKQSATLACSGRFASFASL